MYISPEIYQFDTGSKNSQAIRKYSTKIANESILSYSYPNPGFLKPGSDLFIEIYVNGKNTHIAHSDNAAIVAESVEALIAGNCTLRVAGPDGDSQYIPLDHGHAVELLETNIFEIVILN